jgi:hypothetical protein
MKIESKILKWAIITREYLRTSSLMTSFVARFSSSKITTRLDKMTKEAAREETGNAQTFLVVDVRQH